MSYGNVILGKTVFANALVKVTDAEADAGAIAMLDAMIDAFQRRGEEHQALRAKAARSAFIIAGEVQDAPGLGGDRAPAAP